MLTWITPEYSGKIKTVSQTAIPPALPLYLKGLGYAAERARLTEWEKKQTIKKKVKWDRDSSLVGFKLSTTAKWNIHPGERRGNKTKLNTSFIARKYKLDNK